MFLIDDMLLLPARGLMGAFRRVHDAVQQERAGEAADIRTQLSRLYMMLETGQVTQDTFDAQEKDLLDRFDETDANATRAPLPAAPEQEPPAEKRRDEAIGTRTGRRNR